MTGWEILKDNFEVLTAIFLIGVSLLKIFWSFTYERLRERVLKLESQLEKIEDTLENRLLQIQSDLREEMGKNHNFRHSQKNDDFTADILKELIKK